MRDKRASFSVAIAGAAVLLAGTVVTGGGRKGASSTSAVSQPPSLTSCRVGDFLFTVSSGPSFVPCDFLDGQCTEIEYQVTPRPQTVYALQGKGVVGVSNDGTFVDPCEGFGPFGQGSCHEQAVRTSPDDFGRFKITLAGTRRASPTSVAISIDPPRACEILGIGLENSPNPDETTQTTETIDFKGCVVEFTRDARTGEVVRAQLLKEISPPECEGPFVDPRTGIVEPQPVTQLQVKVKNGPSLGTGKFGEGYISTGSDSCTTRVIGGRVYTWGSPCP